MCALTPLPLQDGVWFCLGHAASKLGDYDLAVKALQHCVSIEPDVGGASFVFIINY